MMKFRTFLFLAGCLPPVALSPAAIHAQAPAASPGMSFQAFSARQTSRLMAADTDGDGRISRAEFEAAMSRGNGDPGKRFDRIDTNHDGFLDKGEINQMLIQRFHRLDSNGDGFISPQERMTAHNRSKVGDPADK